MGTTALETRLKVLLRLFRKILASNAAEEKNANHNTPAMPKKFLRRVNDAKRYSASFSVKT